MHSHVNHILTFNQIPAMLIPHNKYQLVRHKNNTETDKAGLQLWIAILSCFGHQHGAANLNKAHMNISANKLQDDPY